MTIKNTSLAIMLSIATFCSFLQPVLADDNYAATIDSNGIENIEKIPEAIDEDEELEMEAELERLTISEGNTPNLLPSKISTFSVIGEDDRYEVDNTTVKPYSPVCFIALTFPDGYSVSATGWICRDDTLVTAAHCLYHPDHEGWFKSIHVFPGRTNNSDPYDVVDHYVIGYIPNKFKTLADSNYENAIKNDSKDYYKANLYNYDYGVVKLSESIGNKCGHIYTSSKDKYLTYNVEIPGYPETNKFGFNMRTDFGCITDYNKSLLYHDVDETSGQSGAPLIVEHSPGKYTVIGINSGGFDSTSNRAVRTTDTVRDLILKAHNYEP